MIKLVEAQGRLSDQKADIVFCIDATSSMQPCIDGVKDSVNEFLEGLQSAANVDYRLRLIAFRDVHDTRFRDDAPQEIYPFSIYNFTGSIEGFRSQLQNTKADCNQDQAGAESSLDALYLAVTSDWREACHRTVVLITDDDAWPNLHPSTYPYTDNTVKRVIQEFQTLRHAMLWILAPRTEVYAAIEKSVDAADRPINAIWLRGETRGEIQSDLLTTDWSSLMKQIGKSVSVNSVRVGA
jgi:hypothetical protein